MLLPVERRARNRIAKFRGVSKEGSSTKLVRSEIRDNEVRQESKGE